MAHGEWIETTNARIRLREDGIVEWHALQGTIDTLETARENMAVFRRLLGDRAPGPHLIFMEGLKRQTREARVFLSSSAESKQVCNPVALVVGSPLSRVMGNFFLGLSKSHVPLKLFTSEEKAVRWLEEHRS